MTAAAIANHADELDIRLTDDAEHIDVPAVLPDEVEKAIHSNRSEVIYRLAAKEQAEVLARLEALRIRIDDESVPYQDREMLARTDLDRNLDRLSVLERVIREYERSGLAQWYTEGWTMVQSEILGGETVVIVTDASIVATLPEGARSFPVYELLEVRALDGSDDDTIRQVHTIKKTMPGTVEVH